MQTRMDAMERQRATTISAFMMGLLAGLLLALLAIVAINAGAWFGG